MDLVKLQNLTLNPAIPASVCEQLVSMIAKLPADRWIKREQLHPTRATSDFTSCSYYSCLNESIPLDITSLLLKYNPSPESTLQELVINKYHNGDYIPVHRDRQKYRSFALVPLETNDLNGTIVEGELITDIAGRAGIFNGTMLRHAVPPVVGTRYTVLYLYE